MLYVFSLRCNIWSDLESLKTKVDKDSNLSGLDSGQTTYKGLNSWWHLNKPNKMTGLIVDKSHGGDHVGRLIVEVGESCKD